MKSVGMNREGNGNPLQYSCLENPVDRGAWWAAVHGVAQSWTWLKRLSMHACMHALEKEMATHSSILAWRIPGIGEPGELLSMGSHRVRHDWSDAAAAAIVGMNSGEEPEAMSNTGVSPKKTEPVRDILKEKLIYSRELALVIIEAL